MQMTYTELGEKARKVAYVADQIRHKIGRQPDLWTVAASVMFADYERDMTATEIGYVTSEARQIIDQAESVEAKVEAPVEP